MYQMFKKCYRFHSFFHKIQNVSSIIYVFMGRGTQLCLYSLGGGPHLQTLKTPGLIYLIYRDGSQNPQFGWYHGFEVTVLQNDPPRMVPLSIL